MKKVINKVIHNLLLITLRVIYWTVKFVRRCTPTIFVLHDIELFLLYDVYNIKNLVAGRKKLSTI